MTRSGKTRQLLLLLVAALMASTVLVAQPARGATTGQFHLYNESVVHRYNSYAAPQTVGGPTNWTSPIDYANGRAYARLEITDKPSTLPITVQLCFWRHGTTTWQYETCTWEHPASTTGVLWLDLGRPGGWWKLNGQWDWSKGFNVTRIMVKDPATGTGPTRKLLTSRSCGGACHPGGDAFVLQHTPITINAQIVIVSAGRSLQPPASWVGKCPSSWASGCSGGGGSSPPPPPPASGTGGSAVMIAGTTVPPIGDRPMRDRLLAAGYSVRIVDDDDLTPASLDGADLVVLTTSVDISKIPTWLAGISQPLLLTEVNAQVPLGLATTGQEVSGQTSIAVTAPSHPISGGLSGNVAVASSASNLNTGTPGPAAAVIATTANGSAPTIYAYDAGAATLGSAAPARRVMFFYSYLAPTVATTQAWNLFDRAVDWLTTPPPPATPAPGVAGTAVMIAGTTGPPSGDRPIRDRLVAAGYSVVVVDDDALTPSTLTGADVVVVTSSVDPKKIPAWLAGITQPMLLSEAYAQGALGLANSGQEISGQTSIAVTAPSHPIAGGLGGNVGIGSASSVGVGTPGPAANVVATRAGGGGATIYAYETGAATLGAVAPARRVGFFYGYSTPSVASVHAWRLFDNAIDWLTSAPSTTPTTTTTTTPTTTTTTAAPSTTTTTTFPPSTTTTTTFPPSTTTTTTFPPSTTSTTSTTTTTTTTLPSDEIEIVLVAGTSGPPRGDRPMYDRLSAAGYTVRVVDDDELTPAALAGSSLVLVSSSVVPTKIPAWLTQYGVPVLNTEAYAQVALGLATDGGEAAGTMITIEATNSLSTDYGTSYTQAITAGRLGWGQPTSDAEVVVRTGIGAPLPAVYLYEPGDQLVSGQAVSRLAGFFFDYDGPENATPFSWLLFDDTVSWLISGP